jgi:uncharacterized membrane protein (DUF106 family)
MPNLLEIFFIATGLSIIMTYAYKFLTDQALMRELKSEIDKLKKKMKEHRKDPEKLREVQKEMMPLNMKYFKKSMKPTLITLLPFLIIFFFLNQVYSVGGELFPIVPLPFSLPIIGNSLEWIGTYIIFSLVLTTVFRKVLNVA